MSAQAPQPAPQPSTSGTQRPTAAQPAQAGAKPRQPWLWNVVLLDDQDHTYDYVIRMMQELFNHDPDRSLKIAKAVDAEGRAVVMTTHRELAELKAEQIAGFGRDPLLATCKGSMSAILEPAGDEGDNRNGPAGNSGGASGGGGGPAKP
jgi:ATP-dependent Clp protease adaptor protein ClpS